MRRMRLWIMALINQKRLGPHGPSRDIPGIGSLPVKAEQAIPQSHLMKPG